MDTEAQKTGAFLLMQQLRHVRWDSCLQKMTQAEFMAADAIRVGQLLNPGRPGAYVSQLAESLTISVSMVSKMLKILEGKGWITRTVDPQSRRNTFVSLTEAGSELLAEESARVNNLNARVIARMGEDRWNRLMADAQMLAKCYAQELGSD